MSISQRGFASLVRSNPDRQRLIAQSGGRAAQAKGTAHRWSSAEAQAAGRKGGLAGGSRRRVQPTDATPSRPASVLA